MFLTEDEAFEIATHLCRCIGSRTAMNWQYIMCTDWWPPVNERFGTFIVYSIYGDEPEW